MTNRRMYDADVPPQDPHLDVCAFYIGGDTPHVWSDAEIADQSARWRLPIYTCDNPGQRDPVADATAACGWMIRHQVPKGSALALDYETAVNGPYVTAFDRVVTGMGWTLLLYGSLSSVTKNPRPSAGYWTASWTGSAHMDPGAAATQWISDTMLGRGYDLSDVSDSLVLWDTQAPEDDMDDTQANQLAQLYNFVFAGGTDSGETLPGRSTNSLVDQLGWLEDTVKALQTPDPAAFVAALTADTAAMAQLAQAVAAQVPAAPTADEIGAAVAKHLGAALANG